jgi:hypothetical protein
VDVDELRRAGFIGEPPTNWWVARNRLYRAGIQPRSWNDTAITLHDGQVLEIVWQPWHFGGRRASILCPCGRRVRKVFAGEFGPWRCRHCYDLDYETRQVVPWNRMLIKAQNFRLRLGGTSSIFDPFPPRPKGFHRRRYERMRLAHDQAAEKCLSLLSASLNRRTR